MSDTAGTTLSTGVHTGLTQERPRWMTSCTYLGNNRISEPRRPGAGLPPHSAVTTGQAGGAGAPEKAPSLLRKAPTVRWANPFWVVKL